MSRVRSYFERHAAAFDSLYGDESRLRVAYNRLLRGGVYRRAELTVALIERMGQPSVLDVGCGSGRNSLLFHRAGAASVHGVDFSEPMLGLARARAGQDDAVRFEAADFLAWGPGRRWDLVVALGLFDYFPDILPLLRKMRACSKGALCFSIRHPSLLREPVRRLRYRLAGCPIFFYGREHILARCAEAGLSRVEIVEGGSGSYFVTALA